ncbi:MAG TPA: VCBS repeat-containing protein, partial [Polyangiaceae bacterium]|nr:VCBS repeat-containing protein [Polyangiaceae bacterium]
RVLHGGGDGTFASVSNNAVRAQPGALMLGDKNRDGNLDVVLADDALSVLFGRGDGTFFCAQDYLTGKGPTAFSLGDLNGDGRLDVAALYSNSVRVLLNAAP